MTILLGLCSKLRAIQGACGRAKWRGFARTDKCPWVAVESRFPKSPALRPESDFSGRRWGCSRQQGSLPCFPVWSVKTASPQGGVAPTVPQVCGTTSTGFLALMDASTARRQGKGGHSGISGLRPRDWRMTPCFGAV